MSRVHIGLEPADDEPDERPDRLGQALIEIRDDETKHGRWWVVATAGESYVKAAIRRLAGKTDPPGVPGLRDVEGWEARPFPVVVEDKERWQLRVRYTAPAATLPSLTDEVAKVADAKAAAAFDKLRENVGPAEQPADPTDRFQP